MTECAFKWKAERCWISKCSTTSIISHFVRSPYPPSYFSFMSSAPSEDASDENPKTSITARHLCHCMLALTLLFERRFQNGGAELANAQLRYTTKRGPGW
ncbi:hypothetical protein AVEN_165816-1 [Araneus ventricosus]|uniref:Uncharacterized protein n=1 Tax=Araneus ventricosus TaxID=182803 RepID=A0A4Y2ENX5_ARAVE|nr:hypothetical protein AVEN_165816-1 [Araneus ventricosus]